MLNAAATRRTSRNSAPSASARNVYQTPAWRRAAARAPPKALRCAILSPYSARIAVGENRYHHLGALLVRNAITYALLHVVRSDTCSANIVVSSRSILIVWIACVGIIRRASGRGIMFARGDAMTLRGTTRSLAAGCAALRPLRLRLNIFQAKYRRAP